MIGETSASRPNESQSIPALTNSGAFFKCGQAFLMMLCDIPDYRHPSEIKYERCRRLDSFCRLIAVIIIPSSLVSELTGAEGHVSEEFLSNDWLRPAS